jgi:AGCS family alanine or glycine:cation symporter
MTGGFVTVLLGLIIFGGVKRIGATAGLIVPFMAIAYIIVALIIIVLNIGQLPAVFSLIVRSAFGADAAFGSILGLAIQWGVKRGVYSNEAGQGTGPMAAAASEVSHPAEQGLVQAFSVYVDTLFVCSATAFMVLITTSYNTVSPAGGFIVEYQPSVAYGPAYTQIAVDTLLPGFGSAFVAIALFFFAFTTLLAYYYYSESAFSYLFRHSKADKNVIFTVARALLLIMTFYGSIRTADLAWGLGDIAVGMMAWLNIIGIILLTKPGLAVLKDYEAQLKAGVLVPIFDPKRIGITNAPIWDVIAKRNAAKKKII